MDFVGIFKSMHKALSFDSDEINAVIEYLDLLLEQFQHKIEKNFKKILPAARNRDDKLLEKLIYEDFMTVHELLRLKIPNHGRLFKPLMAAYLPEHNNIKLKLTKYSLSNSKSREQVTSSKITTLQ